MTSYLITDPSFYTSTPQTLCEKLTLHVNKYQPHLACLRDTKTTHYETLATPFVKTLKALRVKPILHVNYILANKLNAFGVHLPFTYRKYIPKAKALGLFVIASTHSLEEAFEVERLGADVFTYSPIFDTPNKGKPVGLVKLKEIIDKISIDCYALGGIITQEHITKCSNVGAKGFASIRYFLI